MLDLKKKVVDDGFGEFFPVVRFQSKKNKKTIPAVHLIEAAAGNNVGIGQVEEAGRGQLFRAHIADVRDGAGQSENPDMASFGGLGDIGRRGESVGKIKDWGGCDFCVGESLAICDGTRERIP